MSLMKTETIEHQNVGALLQQFTSCRNQFGFAIPDRVCQGKQRRFLQDFPLRYLVLQQLCNRHDYPDLMPVDNRGHQRRNNPHRFKEDSVSRHKTRNRGGAH
ncbi:hypothetical protein D3C80_1910820 [compost metagenome]